MKEIFDRHDKAALMFSGGKDSLATMFLMLPYKDKITVIYVNTGDAFPETLGVINEFSSMYPNFIEVKTDVKEFKKVYGHPTDLLPTRNCHLNISGQGLKIPIFVSHVDCCSYNLWYPAIKAVNDIGATLIIRGQKNHDYEKSSFKSGDKKNKLEFLFPIEDWSDDTVIKYLQKCGVNIPEHYKFRATSMDCQHCTAYLSEHSDRIGFMKEKYPSIYKENTDTISSIYEASKKEFKNLKEYSYG